MLATAKHDLSELSDDDGMAALESLWKECEQFYTNLKAGKV